MSWLTVGASIIASVRPTLAASAKRIIGKFKGSAYFAGDDAYENKRKSLVWQAIKPQRYPNRIYEAVTEEDIVNTVAEARAIGLPISIVCGGHSYVANGIQDDSILLDLSQLRAVEIDTASRTARVQPGIRSAEFDYLLQGEGLAFPVPHSPVVALGGYLLGGGMGWNAESWNNLACFNIRAVDVILASGKQVTASANQYADLFWAARGGGPLFCGIISRYHLDVFPRPTAIRQSTYIYTIDATDAVIAWMEKARAVQDPKIELTLILSATPPDENNGKAAKQCIVSAVCFGNDELEATRLLTGIAEGAPAEHRVFQEELVPTSIAGLLSADMTSVPIRHSVETFWIDDVVQTTKRIAQMFPSAPSTNTLVYINYRSRPTLTNDAAYSAMGEAIVFSAAIWSDPKDDEDNIRWSDNLVKYLGPFDKAAYINETEFVRHPERARHCFSEANWQRLQSIAVKYDPTGMFASPFLVNQSGKST